MTATELIAWFRKHRDADAPPAGDIREPAVLVEVLTMLLETHLSFVSSVASQRAQLAESERHRYATAQEHQRAMRALTDLTNPNMPGSAGPRQLATLIGYVADLKPQAKPSTKPALA